MDGAGVGRYARGGEAAAGVQCEGVYVAEGQTGWPKSSVSNAGPQGGRRVQV